MLLFSKLAGRKIRTLIVFAIVCSVLFSMTFPAYADNDVRILGKVEAQDCLFVGVTVDDTTAYVVSRRMGHNKLQTFDVSRPGNIVPKGNISLPETGGYKVQIVENFAYVGYGYGVYILDITNPSAMTWEGTYNASEFVNSLEFQVENHILYILTLDGDFNIIDVSDSENPENISSISSTARKYRAIHVENNFAYLTYGENNSDGLSIFDISDVSNPQFLDDLQLPIGHLWSIYSSYGFAYIIGTTHRALQYEHEQTNWLLIVTVSNPGNIFLTSNTEISRIRHGPWDLPVNIVSHLWVNNDYIFLMDSKGSLRIFSNEPRTPTIVNVFDELLHDDESLDESTTFGFYIDKYRAYAATANALYVLDISEYIPYEPFLSKYWWIPYIIIPVIVFIIVAIFARRIWKMKGKD